MFCAGIVQGFFMVLSGKMNMHLYVRRLLGAFFPAMMALILHHLIPVTDTVSQLMNSIVLPIASGSTMVEGMCHATSEKGRKQIIDGLAVAFCLGTGYFLAIKLGGFLGW